MDVAALRRGVLIAGLGMLIAACGPATPMLAGADADAAQVALSTFLELLASGEYEQAAPLYGGSLDSMQAWNPEIDPQDVGGLIGYGCESRLLQCLPVRSVVLRETANGGELVFDVAFSLPDGTLFVRGPCCGATSTEMPDQSAFPFRVRPQADGGFLVLDLPPYVP